MCDGASYTNEPITLEESLLDMFPKTNWYQLLTFSAFSLSLSTTLKLALSIFLRLPVSPSPRLSVFPRLLSSFLTKIVATASDDRSIILWDWQTATISQRLVGHRNSVYSLSFQSSGGTAGGSGAGLLASVSFDWMTLLWDPRRYVGEEKRRE